jgi:hypothetical protein
MPTRQRKRASARARAHVQQKVGAEAPANFPQIYGV